MRKLSKAIALLMSTMIIIGLCGCNLRSSSSLTVRASQEDLDEIFEKIEAAKVLGIEFEMEISPDEDDDDAKDTLEKLAELLAVLNEDMDTISNELGSLDIPEDGYIAELEYIVDNEANECYLEIQIDGVDIEYYIDGDSAYFSVSEFFEFVGTELDTSLESTVDDDLYIEVALEDLGLDVDDLVMSVETGIDVEDTFGKDAKIMMESKKDSSSGKVKTYKVEVPDNVIREILEAADMEDTREFKGKELGITFIVREYDDSTLYDIEFIFNADDNIMKLSYKYDTEAEFDMISKDDVMPMDEFYELLFSGLDMELDEHYYDWDEQEHEWGEQPDYGWNDNEYDLGDNYIPSDVDTSAFGTYKDSGDNYESYRKQLTILESELSEQYRSLGNTSISEYNSYINELKPALNKYVVFDTEINDNGNYFSSWHEAEDASIEHTVNIYVSSDNYQSVGYDANIEIPISGVVSSMYLSDVVDAVAYYSGVKTTEDDIQNMINYCINKIKGGVDSYSIYIESPDQMSEISIYMSEGFDGDWYCTVGAERVY